MSTVEMTDSEPAVLTAAECRRRFDAGHLALDGSDLVPLSFLWYPTEQVVEHMLAALKDDLEVVENNCSAQVAEGLPHVYDLRLRCRDDVRELQRRGPFVRFDKVDRLYCKYGLQLHRLGTPLFSTSPRITPRAA